MHGFFKANGGCGYIKKPDFLLNNGSNDEVFDPKANLPIKKTLKVRPFSNLGLTLGSFLAVAFNFTDLCSSF